MKKLFTDKDGEINEVGMVAVPFIIALLIIVVTTGICIVSDIVHYYFPQDGIKCYVEKEVDMKENV